MPLAALVSGMAFGLPKELALGLILVGCCPGGTASNVICYLARANVALSVLLTMCSTFLAVAMTPLLTKWLAGQAMNVNAWDLFGSMIEIVLIPLLLGLVINHLVEKNRYRDAVREAVGSVGPMVSVVLIVLVVGSIVAGGKASIAQAGWTLFAAVFALHGIGFGLGYVVAKLCGCDVAQCRTVSVEVGMQNSGLGAALAKTHFAAMPLAPIPAAISAVFHCLIGSFLAWYWSRSATSTADRDHS
jgi:BASS family bile acid:Na+ symporter